MMRALGAVLGLALATSAPAQWITPTNPVAFQPVRLTLPPSYVLQQPYDPAQTTVAMVNNRITVTLQPANLQTSTATGVDVPLGRLPAGTYEVWLAETVPAMTDGTVILTSIAAVGLLNVLPPPNLQPLPREDYSDLWWDSDEPGWGVQLTQHSNGQVWSTFLTYAEDGQATWYAVMGGMWTDAATFTGPVYKATGSWFGASGRGASVQAAGTATLSFMSYASATFAYSIDGVTKSRPLQRQAF